MNGTLVVPDPLEAEYFRLKRLGEQDGLDKSDLFTNATTIW